MSTKIYDGFRIQAGSAQANLQLLDTLLAPLQQLVDAKNKKLILERAMRLFDRTMVRALERRELTQEMCDAARWGALSEACNSVQTEQTKCRNSLSRSPLIDCDVQLFLRPHHESNSLLGYLQEERVGARTYLLTVAGVSDFAYWNNTDPPEELAEEEWDARGRLWNEVLDSPRACLTMSFQPGFPSFEDEDLAQLPSLTERAQWLAKNRLLDQAVFKLMTPEELTAYHEKASFAGISRAMRQAEKLMADPSTELGQEFVALAGKFSALLPSAFTLKLLRTSMKDVTGLENVDWEALKLKEKAEHPGD